MSRRFARNGWPTGWTFANQTLTASATPHAVGAYGDIFASLAGDVVMLVLKATADVSQIGVDTSMLVSLAVGGAGSEVDIVSNLVQGGTQGVTSGFGYRMFLPIHIPAGHRLSAKVQAEQVSDTYSLRCEAYFGSHIPDWGGYSICETLGADLANSRGTVISNSAGTWTEITASTANPLRAFNITGGLVDSTSTAVTHIVDVGVGAAGSEVIYGTWQISTSINEAVFNFIGPAFLEMPIPAGSRIAVKKSTTSDLSVAVHGWR